MIDHFFSFFSDRNQASLQMSEAQKRIKLMKKQASTTYKPNFLQFFIYFFLFFQAAAASLSKKKKWNQLYCHSTLPPTPNLSCIYIPWAFLWTLGCRFMTHILILFYVVLLCYPPPPPYSLTHRCKFSQPHKSLS